MDARAAAEKTARDEQWAAYTRERLAEARVAQQRHDADMSALQRKLEQVRVCKCICV